MSLNFRVCDASCIFGNKQKQHVNLVFAKEANQVDRSKLNSRIRTGPPEEVTIESFLRRGVDKIMPEEGLAELIASKRPKIYLGIDPTAPDLHIGHTVPLRKLAQAQRLGFEVILLFGTFTGMIGDPSDKSAARKRLTSEQVSENVRSYKEQAGKILDLWDDAKNPVTVVYNHMWLERLNFTDVVELASHFTVNQLVARDTYAKRLAAGNPLYLHEFLYSLMQGFDSVALDVDIEVGGKDQTPNMLSGSHLMRRLNNKDKWVIGMKLIETPDGQKMGKTVGGAVNLLDWPEFLFESVMAFPDGMIPVGLELLTTVPLEVIQDVEEAIKEGENPSILKASMAHRIVSELHGPDGAGWAELVFDEVKRQGKQPRRMREIGAGHGSTISGVLVSSGLCADEAEARAKLTQGAVRLDGKQIRKDLQLTPGQFVLELGKNSVKNVRLVQIS